MTPRTRNKDLPTGYYPKSVEDAAAKFFSLDTANKLRAAAAMLTQDRGLALAMARRAVEEIELQDLIAMRRHDDDPDENV